jgi:hypothetical protein
LPPVPDIVVQGYPAEFICQSESKQPIYDCRFKVPGFRSELKISDDLSRPKYEFIGEGLSEGECGLRILSAYGNNTGLVRCTLIFEDASEQQVESNLAVLHPVENLRIGSNSIDYEFKEKEQMEFNCSAEGGSPAPTLSLSIGRKLKFLACRKIY